MRWSGDQTLMYLDNHGEGDEVREVTIGSGDQRIARLTSDVFSYDYDLARRKIILVLGVRQRRAVRVRLAG